MSFSSQFELERVQRAAILALLPSINSELGAQVSLWYPKDKAFAKALGKSYSQVTLEKIDPLNMHAGVKPSLLDADPEELPNIVAMCDNAVPDLALDTDHSEAYTERLWIEIMVKGSGDEEDIVNSRIQRTTEAVHNVLMLDRTLHGVVNTIGESPSVVITDQFAGPDKKGRSRFIWQGARMEYQVKKVSPMYQSPGAATAMGLLGLEVDQVT